MENWQADRLFEDAFHRAGADVLSRWPVAGVFLQRIGTVRSVRAAVSRSRWQVADLDRRWSVPNVVAGAGGGVFFLPFSANHGCIVQGRRPVVSGRSTAALVGRTFPPTSEISVFRPPPGRQPLCPVRGAANTSVRQAGQSGLRLQFFRRAPTTRASQEAKQLATSSIHQGAAVSLQSKTFGLAPGLVVALCMATASGQSARDTVDAHVAAAKAAAGQYHTGLFNAVCAAATPQPAGAAQRGQAAGGRGQPAAPPDRSQWYAEPV